jgi:hypothetical protein
MILIIKSQTERNEKSFQKLVLDSEYFDIMETILENVYRGEICLKQSQLTQVVPV